MSFDQAQEGLKSAEASLEDAKAQLGKAKEALGDTELRADAAGVITARRLETGQVVQAAQPVFSLAQDGDRDAIFDVNEEAFFGDIEAGDVSLRLLSDAKVTALGRVREVSPAVDTKTSAVRVKVAIQNSAAGDDAWKCSGGHGQTQAFVTDRSTVDGSHGRGHQTGGVDCGPGDQDGRLEAGNDLAVTRPKRC